MIPLKEMGGFGYFFTDKDGNVVGGWSGRLNPLKYGELMGNDAAHCVSDKRVFRMLNKDREPGYVNHVDGLGAVRFMLSTKGTIIVKHTGPCGAAYGFDDPAAEYAASSAVDEVARFGGIISAPKITKASAEQMVGKQGQKKQDVIVALEYEEGAAEILLAAKSQPLVYKLEDKDFDISRIDFTPGLDDMVLQERISPLQRSDLHVSTGSFPINDKVLDDIIFGFKVADARYSNAIAFVEPQEKGAIAIGSAGGPPDRITASYQAMEKAVAYQLIKYLKVPRDALPKEIHVTLYMASDGFFPDTGALSVATPKEIDVVKGRIAHYPYLTQRDDFLPKDVRELLKEEGWDASAKMKYIEKRLQISVPLVINPGGSKKDDAVSQYAKDNGITMLITERDGRHLRCFKHGPQSAYAVK